jgi:hypothetical protein
MEEPTYLESQQHLQQPTNTRRSKRRVAMTTSLVLIVLSGLFFFTELRGLKLSNYLKNESEAEKSPVVVVVQTEAVEKDIQEKRPKRNRKNEKKARGPAAAARADHNNADDDASTEQSDIRTHIMNQLPDIRAFTKSQPSPVCHPHMQLALPGFKWFNASKFTRLYFYHARKAGGTSLADYFVKVAHHHGLEFQVDEWTAAEEPSTSDKETFYVAHLREPVRVCCLPLDMLRPMLLITIICCRLIEPYPISNVSDNHCLVSLCYNVLAHSPYLLTPQIKDDGTVEI